MEEKKNVMYSGSIAAQRIWWQSAHQSDAVRPLCQAISFMQREQMQCDELVAKNAPVPPTQVDPPRQLNV